MMCIHNKGFIHVTLVTVSTKTDIGVAFVTESPATELAQHFYEYNFYRD